MRKVVMPAEGAVRHDRHVFEDNLGNVGLNQGGVAATLYAHKPS
jgi:hypothetical protein